MTSVAHVAIHPSQFPDQVRRDLLESLRTRQVNHKFHYDSVKQTQKWLALHESYSPARQDADCLLTYYQCFTAVAAQIESPELALIGLGCGGGQKDVRLLALLKAKSPKLRYLPCDVATAMALVARQEAASVVPMDRCFPFVFDMASATNLLEMFDQSISREAARVFTFFGMIPNFEPKVILPGLASLIRPEDCLLFSANLAPGLDYSAGVQKILPQYNNLETKEWLLTFLLDLGVERADGELRFEIETDPANDLQRVVANFHFTRPCQIAVKPEIFDFSAGSVLRLFFSYRYTPDRVSTTLASHGLSVCQQWITRSEEEGVFLCRRTPGH